MDDDGGGTADHAGARRAPARDAPLAERLHHAAGAEQRLGDDRGGAAGALRVEQLEARRQAGVLAAREGLAQRAALAVGRHHGVGAGRQLAVQVFEETSDSLTAAAKLPAEPTSLHYDRTGLSTGDTRWYWLRAVSAEGNVSAFAGPVSAAGRRPPLRPQ